MFFSLCLVVAGEFGLVACALGFALWLVYGWWFFSIGYCCYLSGGVCYLGLCFSVVWFIVFLCSCFTDGFWIFVKVGLVTGSFCFCIVLLLLSCAVTLSDMFSCVVSTRC